jgi:hypothetical protein
MEQIMDHAAVMDGCDGKGDRVGLDKLTPLERTISLVSRFNFEVELGGLGTFYYNSAGQHAIEIVKALKAIGAKQAAAALESANRLLPLGQADRDSTQWHDTLRALANAAPCPFDPFEAAIAEESPDVFCKLCAFIDQHAEELREYESMPESEST